MSGAELPSAVPAPWRVWAPLLAYCGGVVLLSSLHPARLGLPATVGPLPLDVVAHFVEYGLLGVLALRVATLGSAGLWRPAEAWGATLCFGLLFGALDEIHQSFVPGRAVEMSDLLADMAGIVVGTGLWSAWRLRGRLARRA